MSNLILSERNGYIWGMDHLKQLDDVLEFLDDGDRPSMAYLSIQREFTDILDIHLERILDKLCKDGYAGKIDSMSPSYWITYDGLMFVAEGGYRERVRINQIAVRKAKIVDYGIVSAGVGAVVSAVYLLSSAFWDWIFHCCY